MSIELVRRRAWIAYLAAGVAGVPVHGGAAVQGQPLRHVRARPLARRRDPVRHPPAPARVQGPVVLVRRRLPALLARRPVHLQLPEADRQRDAVPVAGRRLLRRGLPGADGRPAARRAPPRGALDRPRRDRRGDPHHRPRGPAVDRADGALPARRRAGHRRQARLGRLPARRRPAAGRRAAPGARRRQARHVVPLHVLGDRAAAGHRLRLRVEDAARHLRQPALARPRLGRLLRAVGRRGAAPVDDGSSTTGARRARC